MFRKEVAGSLLALRQQDEPAAAQPADINARFRAGTIQPKLRRLRRWDVLWAVQDMALRYFALYQRMMSRFAVSDTYVVMVSCRCTDAYGGLQNANVAATSVLAACRPTTWHPRDWITKIWWMVLEPPSSCCGCGASMQLPIACTVAPFESYARAVGHYLQDHPTPDVCRVSALRLT